MATVKKAKKAQNGVTEKTLRPQGIKNQYAEITSKGKLDNIPAPKADTSARAKSIKEGKFREDPKTGDLFPVKKKVGGKVMAKKAKSGVALKKQAAKAPKKAMGGMKMMKGGGKCKYGC